MIDRDLLTGNEVVYFKMIRDVWIGCGGFAGLRATFLFGEDAGFAFRNVGCTSGCNEFSGFAEGHREEIAFNGCETFVAEAVVPMTEECGRRREGSIVFALAESR